jgi:mono/diheme cytochrome c family protein
VRMKSFITLMVLSLAFCLALAAAAKAGNGKDKDSDAAGATPVASHAPQDDPARIEGEKRFHSNCGRCHAAPPKFPPRMMATIIRHMRVRATFTDEDMRLILHYMTQ